MPIHSAGRFSSGPSGPPHRFGRRIFSLLHKKAHQQKADQIQQPDAGENRRGIVDDIRHHEKVEQESSGGSGQVQCRHETPDEPVRNHICEDVVVDRSDDQVEELEHHRKYADQQHAERIDVRFGKEVRMYVPGDRRNPSDQDQEKRHERRCEEQVRNPPAPARPGPVAGRGEDRVHHEIHRRRYAADHQADQRAGSAEMLQRQRQQRRDQAAQHPEHGAAEDHPGRYHDHFAERVAQRADRVRPLRVGGGGRAGAGNGLRLQGVVGRLHRQNGVVHRITAGSARRCRLQYRSR